LAASSWWFVVGGSWLVVLGGWWFVVGGSSHEEMAMRRSLRAALLAAALSSTGLVAQGPSKPSASSAQFEVISIKRNTSLGGGGIRNLPDGTLVMTNQPIRSIIFAASPVPVREVVGLPDWANTERYDVTAKPPAGATREQRSEMMRSLFAERMMLAAHVEERERDTFALVVARSDGRLGPQHKPSTLDCGPRPPGTPPPPPQLPSVAEAQSRCGGLFGQGSIVSGGITMDQLVPSLSGLAGRLVNNRTGLQGSYALTLRFATTRSPGAPPDTAATDDAPEFFTALQEQLGLKLQPEKTHVPVLVVDHIERPTEN
jgi:uncharacterized protein (TIGR03435 family)